MSIPEHLVNLSQKIHSPDAERMTARKTMQVLVSVPFSAGLGEGNHQLVNTLYVRQ